MDKIIKIILSIIGALLMFLAGWVSKAWTDRGHVRNEVKKAISDLNQEHKKALESLKSDYENRIKQKNEIIKKLNEIIDRLFNVLKPLQKDGYSDVNRVVDNLNKNKRKLEKIGLNS